MKPIRSIGIIMDGNRRWAKARGLQSFEGHRKGFETLKKLAEEIPRFREMYGLEYITLYAFSTENWNRAVEEVGFLMDIFAEGFKERLENIAKNPDPKKSVRIRVIGERERLSKTLQKLIADVEEKTAHFSLCTIAVGLSYGGRPEILHAVSSLIESGVKQVTEEEFEKRLWTEGIPNPDLIIRTSGEMRLSNFLPWQGVYSELFFTNTYWPDFTVQELEKIFAEFQEREMRHGT